MISRQTVSHVDQRRSRRRRLAGLWLLTATTLTLAVPLRAVAASDDAAAPAAITRTAWNTDRDHGWGGGFGADGGQQTATVDSEPATKAESAGVVLIDTVVRGGEGAGTGMVLTSSGEVLTNYHVVEGATKITVTVATTGTSYEATVLGSDESADVALLQLNGAHGLDPVQIDHGTVAVGDQVTAVGNAGGTGTLTAADGTVTALKATITTASEGSIEGETLRSLIETDADVVAGDSGGPLVDDEGEVVGIDTAASTGAQIDGYAIPIATALEVVDQIRSGDETSTVRIGSSGYLGVELAAGATQNLGYPTGAAISGVVEGEAAARAGLAAGDVITAVDGTAISSAEDLSEAIGAHDAGDTVTVTWTDTVGGSHTATLTLGANPAA